MAQGNADRREALERIRAVYTRRMHRKKEFHGQAPQEQRPSDRRRWAAYGKLLAQARLLPLAQRDILDVGCQSGTWLALCRLDWGQQGGQLCGLDLMEDWVKTGRRLYEYLDLQCGSGDRLPWPDGSFDLVHQGMVFSSVLEAHLRDGIAAEMRRVVRPGGYVLWYDFFFNPKNPDTVGMTMRRVRRHFPGWKVVARRRITLVPPLARVLQRVSGRAVDALTALRIFNTHHLILLRHASGQAPPQIPGNASSQG
jgi:SAM-dependent methyltransferase